jgi:5-dehydro-2-deoxygluconokinase
MRKNMSDYLIRSPNGFLTGYNAITHIGEVTHDTGINFGILKLTENEEYNIHSDYESAYLLIQGKCLFIHDAIEQTVERHSIFDEDPFTLHVAAKKIAKIKALTDCEFAVSAVINKNDFATQIYDSTNMLESEHRGKDLLDDTAYRIVRTIFDIRNSPHAKLVLGEVITAPGRWSSYPPHHHEQPEIYHYRFTEPQGYGHSECGDAIFKVRQYDTYKILNENDHAQTAAPGYGMYYIWIIRHFEDKPYDQPTFTPEHSWTKSIDANARVWKGTWHDKNIKTDHGTSFT